MKEKRARNRSDPRRDASSHIKAGGETPARRFADTEGKPGYAHRGDIERPPFEGHPDHAANKARPHQRREKTRETETEGQHGQRPAHAPQDKGGV